MGADSRGGVTLDGGRVVGSRLASATRKAAGEKEREGKAAGEKEREGKGEGDQAACTGTQFTCFTSTKAQILTQKGR